LKLIDEGEISVSVGKKVFARMFQTGAAPEEIIKAEGFKQISDESQLLAIVNKVIKAHPQSVQDYLGGKEKAAGFLVGQIMRETKGQANPQLLKDLLYRELDKLKD